MFATGIATDTIIVIIMVATAYMSAHLQLGAKVKSHDPPGRETSNTEPKGFWSSLDQASKVAIITSLITALTGILTTTIGVLFK